MRAPFSDKAIARFWSRVERRGANECWPFQTHINGSGYGTISLDGRHLGAHVASFILHYGELPPGHYCCHTCDNRRCCNPDHLFAGTQSANILDCTKKGRNGAHLHPERLARGDRHGRHTKPERTPRGERNGRFTQPERTARGERNGRAARKLTDDQVKRIRSEYAKGGASLSALGDRYGVSRSAIHLIVTGRNWGWLDG
jgi:hypothetical protein